MTLDFRVEVHVCFSSLLWSAIHAFGKQQGGTGRSNFRVVLERV